MRNVLEASFGLALVGVASLGCGSESSLDGAQKRSVGDGMEATGAAMSAPGLPINNDPHTVDYCKQGMTIGTMQIDVKAERCTIAQIPELIEAAAKDPEMWLLEHFLSGPVSGDGDEYQKLIEELPTGVAWAEFQCSPYYKDAEDAEAGEVSYCAHIVDRYPDGSVIDDSAGVLKNFFMLYVPDEYAWGGLVTAGVYWEHARLGLTKPDYTEVPVELQGVGYVNEQGEWSVEPPQESLLVGAIGDPRDCGGCVDVYSGPHSDLVHPHYLEQLLAGAFNPAFTFSSCEFQNTPTTTVHLTPTQCQAEQTYRTNR